MNEEFKKLTQCYQAFIFDLNGTMIDDMSWHIKAWHRILNELGANISIEKTKEECYGKNHELIERIFPGRFTNEEKERMSFEKEKQYQAEFRPHLELINGLESFLKNAASSGIRMAIGSAAIMFNIDFVLDGLNLNHFFDVIISADDVIQSKPDPETFIKCAFGMGVAAKDCLVFEDAPKGAESAKNAGMDCVIITTMHHPPEFENYDNIISFIEDYNNFTLT